MTQPQPFGSPNSWQQPPAGFPAAEPPKKKSKKLLIAGCGGCLFVVLACCVTSGYLAYLEEGGSYNEPGKEVLSYTVQPAVPFQATYSFDGFGYARHDLWLEVTGAQAAGEFELSSTISCSEYQRNNPSPRTQTLDDYGVARKEYTPTGFTAWFRVADNYDKAPASVQCIGSVAANKGVITNARLVVTRKQRPSDWFSGF